MASRAWVHTANLLYTDGAKKSRSMCCIPDPKPFAVFIWKIKIVTVLWEATEVNRYLRLSNLILDCQADDRDSHSILCPAEESPNMWRASNGNHHFILHGNSELLPYRKEEQSVLEQHKKVGQELRNAFHTAAEIYPESEDFCWNLIRRFQLPILLSEKCDGNFLATSYGHECLCSDSWTAFPHSVVSNSHCFRSDRCGTMLPFDLVKLFFHRVSLFSGSLLADCWSDPSWVSWWDLVQQVLLDDAVDYPHVRVSNAQCWYLKSLSWRAHRAHSAARLGCACTATSYFLSTFWCSPLAVFPASTAWCADIRLLHSTTTFLSQQANN